MATIINAEEGMLLEIKNWYTLYALSEYTLLPINSTTMVKGIINKHVKKSVAANAKINTVDVDLTFFHENT